MLIFTSFLFILPLAPGQGTRVFFFFSEKDGVWLLQLAGGVWNAISWYAQRIFTRTHVFFSHTRIHHICSSTYKYCMCMFFWRNRYYQLKNPGLVWIKGTHSCPPDFLGYAIRRMVRKSYNHQLRLVVDPIIYMVKLYTSQVVVVGFPNNSITHAERYDLHKLHILRCTPQVVVEWFNWMNFHGFLSANAHRKINVETENHPFGNENHLQNLHFWVPCFFFVRGGCIWIWWL